jgi:hypothetical protein
MRFALAWYGTLFGSSHPIALDEWSTFRLIVTTRRHENILLNDLAYVVDAHSLYSRISLRKNHIPFDVIEWDIFFRLFKGSKVWSSTTYLALENSIVSTIALRKALVFVSAIHKALKSIAKRVDSFKDLNLRII